MKHTTQSELNPQFKKRDLFVYIIESPSDVDIYHGRNEGDAITRVLKLAGIPHTSRSVITKNALKAALILGFEEGIKKNPESLPIIHISAHGDDKGIGLADGTVVSWDSLRELLIPINKSLSGNKLVLCMSSCHGFNALKMAMYEDDEFPFVTVVGNMGNPTWSDTTIGYATFYHLIKKGAPFKQAVESMKLASGDNNFLLASAKQGQKLYKTELARAKEQPLLKEGTFVT